ncbi:hypothetical protein WICMUC_005498 [Wickerhamomyces mucosus]|uniref:Uncharacterized protein n=1 Tax=Wickerhamomyces mucosus TaxID=1378264 RepID=A0A9P8T675_9ASCO|nr:hypothetical protein WICMUC_005498 [Wickerhamomyces mucosus]
MPLTQPRPYSSFETSSEYSNGNSSVSNTHTYGIIKVYHSDEGDESSESLAMNSLKIYDNENFMDQSSLNNLMKSDRGKKTIMDFDNLIIQTNPTSLERQPPHYYDQNNIQFCHQTLTKIINSYESPQGDYLNSNIFLNNKIYHPSSLINSGSVKLNIIQEINNVLQKMILNDKPPSIQEISANLEYYDKLMNAFEILNFDLDESVYELHKIPTTTHQTQPITTPASPQVSSSISSSKHKGKRSSILFDKFRSKGKTTQTLSLDSKSVEPSNSTKSAVHSRSPSNISVTSSSSATRSAKDQIPLADYLHSIQSLNASIGLIVEHFLPNENQEFLDNLNHVVQFINKYIIRFIVKDVLGLTTKFMKLCINEYLSI